jgi:hypothetical protein
MIDIVDINQVCRGCNFEPSSCPELVQQAFFCTVIPVYLTSMRSWDSPNLVSWSCLYHTIKSSTPFNLFGQVIVSALLEWRHVCQV